MYAEKGDLSAVEQRLQDGDDPNSRDEFNCRALHYAANKGRVDVVNHLLKCGSLVDAIGQQGWTALHYAARKGNIVIVKQLVEYGADTEIRDDDAHTPKQLATLSNRTAVADFLNSLPKRSARKGRKAAPSNVERKAARPATQAPKDTSRQKITKRGFAALKDAEKAAVIPQPKNPRRATDTPTPAPSRRASPKRQGFGALRDAERDVEIAPLPVQSSQNYETASKGAKGRFREPIKPGASAYRAEVELRVEPLGHAGEIEFVNNTIGGAIPEGYILHVERGVREAAAEGVKSGHPVRGVRVALINGASSPLDANGAAFANAGHKAFKAAMRRSKPVVRKGMTETAAVSELREVRQPETSVPARGIPSIERVSMILEYDPDSPNGRIRELIGDENTVQMLPEGFMERSAEKLERPELADTTSVSVQSMPMMASDGERKNFCNDIAGLGSWVLYSENTVQGNRYNLLVEFNEDEAVKDAIDQFLEENVHRIGASAAPIQKKADDKSWYLAEDSVKSVRQVIVELPAPRPIDSNFGMLILGSNYHALRSTIWTTGLFRLEDDPGPYLLVRADGYGETLKSQPMRIAFCFYRMKAGGLIAIFVDFPHLRTSGTPYDPFVLFEMIRGIDLEDERQRIGDAINLSQLRVCVAEGDGPGTTSNGMWSGGTISGLFDIMVDLEPECRNALNREWKSLLEYHGALSEAHRDFEASVGQMQQENPLTENPLIDRPRASNRDETAAAGKKKWWQFWKRDVDETTEVPLTLPDPNLAVHDERETAEIERRSALERQVDRQIKKAKRHDNVPPAVLRGVRATFMRNIDHIAKRVVDCELEEIRRNYAYQDYENRIFLVVSMMPWTAPETVIKLTEMSSEEPFGYINLMAKAVMDDWPLNQADYYFHAVLCISPGNLEMHTALGDYSGDSKAPREITILPTDLLNTDERRMTGL